MTLRFPKPTALHAVRASRRAAARVERAMCRRQVLARDHYRCRICHLYGGTSLDVHEILPRARGGSPYDPTNCLALCRRCHRDVTLHTITIAVRRGPDGLIWTFTHADRHWTVAETASPPKGE